MSVCSLNMDPMGYLLRLRCVASAIYCLPALTMSLHPRNRRFGLSNSAILKNSLRIRPSCSAECFWGDPNPRHGTFFSLSKSIRFRDTQSGTIHFFAQQTNSRPREPPDCNSTSGRVDDLAPSVKSGHWLGHRENNYRRCRGLSRAIYGTSDISPS